MKTLSIYKESRNKIDRWGLKIITAFQHLATEIFNNDFNESVSHNDGGRTFTSLHLSCLSL